MGTINLSDYKGIYLQAAKEYSDSLLKSCDELANNPSDKKSLTQLHISSHSLRSQSEVMNYKSMSSITCEIEKISRACLEGRFILSAEIIPILKEASMEVSLLLSDIEKNNNEKNVDYLVKKLEEAIKT